MGNRELAERFIARLEARDWDAWAGLLHPAVVYEIPQSRERIRGRDRYLRFNRDYPGDWHLRPKVTIADERHGVVWFEWLLDGRCDDAVAFFEFADGLFIGRLKVGGVSGEQARKAVWTTRPPGGLLKLTDVVDIWGL